MTEKLRQLFVAASFIFVCQNVHGQILAVHNDLAMDALTIPNLGFELRVGERSTIALNGLFSRKVLGQKFECVAFQPEYRYWFGGRPMLSYFVGFGGIIGNYDVDWKRHIYKGEAAGAGVTIGYVARLSSRFNVDFHAGVGVVAYRCKEYYDGDHYEYFTRDYNSTGTWLMPTRIGVSISYIIK